VASEPDYRTVLRAVAREIEKLRVDFPQLKEFSAAHHARPEDLQIAYEFHTHRPQGRAGWVACVPNPDDDGLWFYLDFHDPGSMAQIHTQPVIPKGRLGKKSVMLLILEGAETPSVRGRIWQILEKNGVKSR
jgi:hypothetical protein